MIVKVLEIIYFCIWTDLNYFKVIDRMRLPKQIR